MDRWEKFCLVISIIFGIVVGLVALYLVGRALMSIAPVVTVLFVLFFTVRAAEKGYGVIATTGIILYILSWLALDAYGYWPSVFLAGLGVLTWLAAVLASFGALEPVKKFFEKKHAPIGTWP